MWDELRRRHPHLAIDNCASGGRRIDLETVTRSLPLWRSDTQCEARAYCEQDQAQTAGLSRFVPLNAAGLWGFDPYTYRSLATTGFSIGLDTRDPAQCPPPAVARLVAEVQELRPFWLGDFHVLTPVSVEDEQWMVWQCHRRDLDAGFVMAFRRSLASERITVALRGLDPQATYELRDVDAGISALHRGAQLLLVITQAPGSRLLRYQRRQ
jgi:alpha-galactosidase